MDVHPTKNVSIGIDPYPYGFTGVIDLGKSEETMVYRSFSQ
jgi:hypothetical protein